LRSPEVEIDLAIVLLRELLVEQGRRGVIAGYDEQLRIWKVERGDETVCSVWVSGSNCLEFVFDKRSAQLLR
jgi:hypothetical protein